MRSTSMRFERSSVASCCWACMEVKGASKSKAAMLRKPATTLALIWRDSEEAGLIDILQIRLIRYRCNWSCRHLLCRFRLHCFTQFALLYRHPMFLWKYCNGDLWGGIQSSMSLRYLMTSPTRLPQHRGLNYKTMGCWCLLYCNEAKIQQPSGTVIISRPWYDLSPWPLKP